MPTRVASNSVSFDNRAKDLRLALLLTYITVGWMTIARRRRRINCLRFMSLGSDQTPVAT